MDAAYVYISSRVDYGELAGAICTCSESMSPRASLFKSRVPADVSGISGSTRDPSAYVSKVPCAYSKILRWCCRASSRFLVSTKAQGPESWLLAALGRWVAACMMGRVNAAVLPWPVGAFTMKAVEPSARKMRGSATSCKRNGNVWRGSIFAVKHSTMPGLSPICDH